MNKNPLDNLADFRKVNVDGTLNLARQAATAGVKKFIFLSSIKVNGESTEEEQSFTEDDLPCPEDAYAISKFEAEEGLRYISKNSKMKVIIIRPVLVYGQGVKGNFLSIIRWIRRSVPLPLGGIHNARSFLSLDNLIDFIIVCLKHPAAGNHTFIVSDGEDISTTELLSFIADGIGVKIWLIPVPKKFIWIAGRFFGKTDIARRLCCNLRVDISKAKNLLGWTPPINTREGLVKTFSKELK